MVNDVTQAELTPKLAGACGVDLIAGGGILVTGAVALEGDARFSGAHPASRIMYQFVNDNEMPSAVATGVIVPLVGAPALCTDGITPCTTNSDCPALELCETQLPLTDPANPNVIKTGMAPEYLKCHSTIAAVPVTDALVASLVQTKKLGDIDIPPDGTMQIDIDHGQQVLDIGTLHVGPRAHLILNGFADTVVVLRISGNVRIGTLVQVTLGPGMTPNNILWTVLGAGRAVLIPSHITDFPGTVLAAKRRIVWVGVSTTVQGALIGKRVRLSRQSTVFHRPFTAILQGGTTEAMTIRSAQLRYSPPGMPDSGAVRITLVVDDGSTQAFQSALMQGGVLLNVSNVSAGGQFQTSIALTQCSGKGNQIFHCKNPLTNTRAIIRQLHNDPNTWRLNVVRSQLTTGQTGPVQPDGPVTVTLHEDDGQRAVDRVGEIASCKKHGTLSLTCRTR